jgi:hypothetical protein
MFSMFRLCALQTVKMKDIFSGEDTETADVERGWVIINEKSPVHSDN